MRVRRIVTNETCNQNCWFCNARRPAEDPDFIAKPAVRRRIAEARSGDVKEIVLTGGEPTARNDIADLVRRAGAGGARVVLETNATLIDPSRAAQLAGAGLTVARVQLVAWGSDADAITRDPGGFEKAVEGLRALAGAGVTVEVTVPIVRRNLLLVARLPREIATAGLPVETLILVVPTSAPDTGECAPLLEAARAIATVADAARRFGLTVRIDPSTYVPLCLFEKPERVAHLYALNRGHASRPGFERVTFCEACLIADRCPGVPAGAISPSSLPSLHPVLDDRLRRRVTVVSSIEEQVTRELVSLDDFRSSENGRVPEYTVRVNFHCNQSCEFCFVSTHLPPPAEQAVRAAIETAGHEKAVLLLSGGEPTLNPKLVDYVKLAKQSGVSGVELQTNAIRLANPALVQSLVEAGLDRAMVSLHGSTAAISDAITGAPGTFESTLRGIDEMNRAGIHLRLNFVFCQANLGDFPRFVDLVASRWPGVGIVFSFVGSHTDVVPRKTELIPSFTQIMPSLLDGLARARAARITVWGFDSMCGLPICMVPEEERGSFSQVAVPADAGGGEFVKGEACSQCAEAFRCAGIRRGYAELYGFSELRPVHYEAGASA